MMGAFTAPTSGSGESTQAICWTAGKQRERELGDAVLKLRPRFISRWRLYSLCCDLDEPAASYVCLRLMQASITFGSPTRLEDESDARELSRRIKERAQREGFEKVGIVPATALDKERNQLNVWL